MLTSTPPASSPLTLSIVTTGGATNATTIGIAKTAIQESLGPGYTIEPQGRVQQVWFQRFTIKPPEGAVTLFRKDLPYGAVFPQPEGASEALKAGASHLVYFTA